MARTNDSASRSDARRRRALVGVLGVLAAGPLAVTACSDRTDVGRASAALGELPACSASATATASAPSDPLPPSRVLRRISLALTGKPPTEEAYDALEAATDQDAQKAVLDQAVDAALASPAFYDTMVDFGHQWMRTSAFLTGAQGDGYWGNQSTHMSRCGDMTKHPGAYYILREDPNAANACSDLDSDGNPSARLRQVEPWWAPGTTVDLVGDAAETVASVVDKDGKTHDCGFAGEGYYNMNNAAGCGCGPAAAWCYPNGGLGSGGSREGSQGRDIWDESARLVGHLAWYDRPLSDVVLGNYTVGTNRVRAWYLRFGRQTGLYNDKLDANTTWFKPASDTAPRDPRHPDSGDADAWREFVVDELAPQLMSLTGGVRSADLTRTLAWDPRTSSGPAPGLPMAGVLTMPGHNSSFPRERPRAARALEIFSCRQFNPPPADQHYSPVGDDLATTGQCQFCHALMDPVALTFKRWNFFGNYVPLPKLVGLANRTVPPDLYDPAKAYTYNEWFGGGAGRWKQNWLPSTTMTPATKEELDKNISALFVDTIPTSYTVFGQHPDGTMGPLGFAKVLVQSGEFDRCAAQRLYERFVGRGLDPSKEPGFIQSLGARFATGGRQVRPFVRYLLTTSDFGRGF